MEIKGILIVEIFSSVKDNFRICKIESIEEGNTVISGYFNKLEKNVEYVFSGEYVMHKKYGKQFNVKTVKISIDSKEGIISYFSSELFPGVGVKLAEKIYEKLGNDAVDSIIKDKTILYDITNEKKASIIYDVLINNEDLNSVLIELNNMGINNKMGIKIYEKFGYEAIEIIKSNPYELMIIDGFGFKKCDELALQIGIEEFSEFRISAIILYTLQRYSFQTGNAYLFKQELIEYVLQYLNYQVSDNLIDNLIEQLIKEKKIVFDKYLYLNETYYCEKSVSNSLLKKNERKIDIDDDYINTLINVAESKMTKIFDDMQKKAIINAVKNPISIISGGPGVGKTTIINAIILVYQALYGIDLEKNELMLMAPTGKAARKMMDTLNVKAQTIHKALGFSENGRFEYNEKNHLSCKYLIVDETSMLDIYIAKALFCALNDDVSIVLVGDVNQLPSVNVGNVLSDLIESNLFNVTYLNTIYRQKNSSGIVKLAKMINEKKIDESVFMYQDIKREIINIFEFYEYLKKEINTYLSLGYKLKDIVVLAPLYRGFAGINEINKFLQREYNKTNDFIEYNDILFKIGDKVIQLKNDSNKNISNGDTGIIKSIITKGDIKLYVDIDSVIVEYTYEDLKNLALAYCISVHKAQGSEYKVVIAPLFREYSIMLKKKLFYTCITRAKERLSIFCDEDAINIAVNTEDEKRRSTLISMFENKYIYFDNFKFFNVEFELTPYDFLDE